MSRLVEKLKQVSSGAAKPMGFRPAAARTGPRMLLVAAVAAGDAAAAKGHADAVLLEGARPDKKLASALEDMPCGLTLDKASVEQLSGIERSGCDFIVCHAESAPLAVLQEGAVGTIVEVEPSLPDGLLRATAQLPINAVLIGGDPSLSIQRLMVCQHLANLIAKPLLARAPAGMSPQELRELWETGLAGVVVSVSGDASDELSKLRQAIASLPASRRRREERAEAALPYLGTVEEVESEIEEEE